MRPSNRQGAAPSSRPRRRHGDRAGSKSETSALLAEFARSRDPNVREALLAAHEHLAVYLARKFANRGETLDDLLQVARIGLLKAIDRYNPSLGFAFTTYATPTI